MTSRIYIGRIPFNMSYSFRTTDGKNRVRVEHTRVGVVVERHHRDGYVLLRPVPVHKIVKVDELYTG